MLLTNANIGIWEKIKSRSLFGQVARQVAFQEKSARHLTLAAVRKAPRVIITAEPG